MISPHTFELSMETNKDVFDNYCNQVKHKRNFDKKSNTDYSHVNDGITVWYHKTQFKRKIKLIVNPSQFLGHDDLVKLWKPSEKNIGRLLLELESQIDDCFDSNYNLNDFRLSRIDFTKNVRVEKREIVSAYIKYLYNIRKVKGLSPKEVK